LELDGVQRLTSSLPSEADRRGTDVSERTGADATSDTDVASVVASLLLPSGL
jgi:hypothetical protein